MRTEQEMMDLILSVARADERIRAVLLVGSRANPAVPKDIYQDYDITYFVADIAPFYNNPAWVEECKQASDYADARSYALSGRRWSF